MTLRNSPKAKPDLSEQPWEQPRMLTQSEIALLRQDMQESGGWMRGELLRQSEQQKENLNQ